MAIKVLVCKYKPGLEGFEKFKDKIPEELTNTAITAKLIKVLKHGSVYKINGDAACEYLGEVVIVKGPWIILKCLDVLWGEELLCGSFKETYDQLMRSS